MADKTSPNEESEMNNSKFVGLNLLICVYCCLKNFIVQCWCNF